jgi:hypothetical protein
MLSIAKEKKTKHIANGNTAIFKIAQTEITIFIVTTSKINSDIILNALEITLELSI